MRARYQSACYDRAARRHALLILACSSVWPVGACSKAGTNESDVVTFLKARPGVKLEPVELGALEGKVIVLSVVPSIDTRVCEAQTHEVSDVVAQMPITASRDLPFAQARFAEDAQSKAKFASDYHGGHVTLRA